MVITLPPARAADRACAGASVFLSWRGGRCHAVFVGRSVGADGTATRRGKTLVLPVGTVVTVAVLDRLWRAMGA